MSQGCPVPSEKAPPRGPFDFDISILGTKNDPGKGAKSNVPRGFGNCGRPALPRPAVPVGRPEGAHAARWTRGAPAARAARTRAQCAPHALRGEPASRQGWGQPVRCCGGGGKVGSRLWGRLRAAELTGVISVPRGTFALASQEPGVVRAAWAAAGAAGPYSQAPRAAGLGGAPGAQSGKVEKRSLEWPVQLRVLRGPALATRGFPPRALRARCPTCSACRRSRGWCPGVCVWVRPVRSLGRLQRIIKWKL